LSFKNPDRLKKKKNIVKKVKVKKASGEQKTSTESNKVNKPKKR